MKSSEKACRRCHKRKPLKAFGFSGKAKGERVNVCRECWRIKIKKAQERFSFYMRRDREKAKKRREAAQLNRTITNIYVIQSIVGGPVKIGTSKNVRERIKCFQIGSPFELIVLKVIKKVPSQIEIDLHKQLSEYRLHGEWFKEDILSIIDERVQEVLKRKIRQ